MVLLSKDELSNIFYGARPAIEHVFGVFRIGRTGQADASVPHSPRVLTLDVFGTLMFCRSRDRICDQFATLLNVPTGGPWEVRLDFIDADTELGEKQSKTPVDVMLAGRHSVIVLECRFAEIRSEPCGQTKKTGKGRVQCNGNYEMQTNPVNRRTAFCALTGKGVRYWQHIPDVFLLSADEPHRPCPFAGSWYRTMRTLVSAHAMAGVHKLIPAVGLVYVDRPTMPLYDRINKELPEIKRLLTDAVKFELLRFENLPHLFETAGEPGEQALFRDLHHWVTAKVNWVEARMTNERAGRTARGRR